MSKYQDEKDFIKQEFMKAFDPTIVRTELTEDDKNYYLAAYIEEEKFNIATFYKDKITEVMQLYEDDNEENKDNI